jgi:hypothetical protein
MSEDRTARKVLDVRKDFGDHYAEIEVWEVPPSERYPDEVKYTMQFGNPDGETLVRYDNFPDHPGVTNHHKHTQRGVEDVEFESLHSLVRQFKTEVRDHGYEW